MGQTDRLELCWLSKVDAPNNVIINNLNHPQGKYMTKSILIHHMQYFTQFFTQFMIGFILTRERSFLKEWRRLQ